MDELAVDFRAVAMDAAESAMLEYAEKLTRTPREVREQDVRALRAAGLDDVQVLDVVQVTAYFNFVNRLVEGLGVELEPASG